MRLFREKKPSVYTHMSSEVGLVKEHTGFCRYCSFSEWSIQNYRTRPARALSRGRARAGTCVSAYTGLGAGGIK